MLTTEYEQANDALELLQVTQASLASQIDSLSSGSTT
jgi:hypothetical protein